MFTQFMRRSLITSGLLLGATLAFAPHAFAQTTGTVTLSGSVSTTLALTTTATTGAGGAGALDLSSGEKIAKVADLGISTNNSTGYTLSATSGSLAKADGQTPITYQVTSVDNNGTAPLSAAFTVASGTAYTVSTTASGTVDKDLYIKYTPAALQDPGTYGSSISLTVTDNS